MEKQRSHNRECHWVEEGSESGGLQEDMRHKQPPLLLSWLHFVRLAKMTVTQ